jgi:hypothetical protein
MDSPGKGGGGSDEWGGGVVDGVGGEVVVRRWGRMGGKGRRRGGESLCLFVCVPFFLFSSISHSTITSLLHHYHHLSPPL